MKRAFWIRTSTGRLAAVAFVLGLAGCDAGVEFNPVGPSYTPFAPLDSERSLEITGRLIAQDGACVEATILYDGREVPGARAECGSAHGCDRLELSGSVRSSEGHHTLSFRVLRQSRHTVEYRAEATIRVRREGMSFAVTLPLEPARARLQSGESVSFDVHFVNSLDW